MEEKKIWREIAVWGLLGVVCGFAVVVLIELLAWMWKP